MNKGRRCDQGERVSHCRDVKVELVDVGGQYSSLVVGFEQGYIPVSVVRSNLCTQKSDSLRLLLITVTLREHTVLLED